MLRSNSKSPTNHVVSPEEEKERLQWEGFAEKEGRLGSMNRTWRNYTTRCTTGWSNGKITVYTMYPIRLSNQF